MASGFTILNDGRAFARKASTYDYIIKSVVSGLVAEKSAEEFIEWLKTLTPQALDQENGYGGFIKISTGENIERWLDLRELTQQNQKLFWEGLKNTLASLLQDADDNKEEIALLQTLIQMNHLALLGADPNDLTDWKDGYSEPPSNGKMGPGW